MYALAEFALSIASVAICFLLIYMHHDSDSLHLLVFMCICAPLTLGHDNKIASINIASQVVALAIVAYNLARFVYGFVSFSYMDYVGEITPRQVLSHLRYDWLLNLAVFAFATIASTGAFLMLRRALYFAIFAVVSVVSAMRAESAK